jgi:hypothetical protein
MGRETLYIVQAFNAGKDDALTADTPISCKSAAAAVRTAERLAASKYGVIAYSATGDSETGDYDDQPMVFFRTGQIPSTFA